MKGLIDSKPIDALTNFFSEIVGKPLIDGAGILYVDAIRLRRIQNTLKLEKKYNLIKSSEPTPTTLSFGYMLLEKASLEENNLILEKWAKLLANATDRNFKLDMRKIFIDILEKLEPHDVKTFDEMNQYCLSKRHEYKNQIRFKNYESDKLETLNVLHSLGLIIYGVIGGNPGKTQIISFNPTFPGLDNIKITELGQSFYKAVTR